MLLFLIVPPPLFFFSFLFFLDSFVEKTMAHDGGLIIKKGEPNGRQSLDEFNFAFFFFFHVCSPQEILNSSAAAAIICICTAKKKRSRFACPDIWWKFFSSFRNQNENKWIWQACFLFCFVFIFRFSCFAIGNRVMWIPHNKWTMSCSKWWHNYRVGYRQRNGALFE